MASQNTKYLIRSKGSQLEAITTTKPTITDPYEVMIRLKAVAINPADVKMIDEGHRISSWPLVAGLDGAGIVEAVGEHVNSFAAGDRVLAAFEAGDRSGSFQKVAVVNESLVAKIPSSLSFEDAASLAVSYRTALSSLGIGLKTPLTFLKDGPTSGFTPSSVLILGGSSALGAATTQLLRLAFSECKILTTNSPKHHSHMTKLGVDVALDRSSLSLIKDVKSATPGARGVDAIIDAVGAGAVERHIFDTFDENGPKGYAQVWTGDEEIEVPRGVNSVLFRARDLSRLQGGKNIMLSLQTLLEEGKYQLPLPVKNVGEGYDGLKRGLDLVRKGVSGEKVVVTM